MLQRSDREGQQRLQVAVEGGGSGEGEASRPFLPDFEEFARSVLDWKFSPRGYAGGSGAPLPDELSLHLPDYGETLCPDFAVREREPEEDGSGWQLLVRTLETGQDFDRVAADAGRLEATPHSRLERLLRAKNVPAGLLFNGRSLRLVSAPRSEISGWMDFRVADMLLPAGRPICTALRLLLNERRLLALPRNQRLAALLTDSRKYQNEVSEKLAVQVLHALYELLRGFQAAHDASRGDLLNDQLREDPGGIYRGLLTIVLRLVFLLFAEERDLLSEDETFVRHYSLASLHDRLRADAALHPDTMDQRFGAWAQLLALFRMVHNGAKGAKLRLPPRHGVLFDPDRYTFLEGRPLAAVAQNHERVTAPLVSDGTIHRALAKLLVLDGERLSYRALDVEHIGAVYETMMGFRLERAEGRSAAIKAARKHGAPTTVNLEALLTEVPSRRVRWLREQTDRNLTGGTAKALRDAVTLDELHAALDKVIDRDATPDLVRPGDLILQPNEERRRSGSHYTPRELTEPIVRHTLEPILDRLRRKAADGATPRPTQILDLKVCDPAMGSGAFLVEACRQLADVLVDSWHAHDAVPTIPADEDETVRARRLVARNCLYGVDRNPVAVDLAKLSLWLVTLARDHPLTFLDHALREGDSLVGLTVEQIQAFHWKGGEKRFQAGIETTWIREQLENALVLRREIQHSDDETPDEQLRSRLKRADAELARVKRTGDLLLAAFFEGAKPSEREEWRMRFAQDLQSGSPTPVTEASPPGTAERPAPRTQGGDGPGPLADPTTSWVGWLDELRSADPPLSPFHWEVEFPEVLLSAERENPGFDAVVGNPPFLGGSRISTVLGTAYRNWLREVHAESHGNADLVAHFFRRVFDLLREGGALGMIATNTIAQGDTRSGGLQWICTNGGEIYRVIRRLQWPGLAAVVVSIVHIHRGPWPVSRTLDGKEVPEITAFLFYRGGHDDPKRLKLNDGRSFKGSTIYGNGFTFDDTDKKGVATPLAEMERMIATNPRNREAIFPYIGGKEVNTSPTHAHHRYVINFRDWPQRRERMPAQTSRAPDDGAAASWSHADDEQRRVWLRSGVVPVDYPGPVAADWPELLRIVEERIKPERAKLRRASRRTRWWWYGDRQPALQAAIAAMNAGSPAPGQSGEPEAGGRFEEPEETSTATATSDPAKPRGGHAARRPNRVLALSSVGQHASFAFLPANMVYAHSLILFPLSSHGAFCALQSRPHELWARFFGSSMKDDLRYTPSDCFETFPFPDNWESRPALEAAGKTYYDYRAALMVENDEGLTATYNRFHDRSETSPAIQKLRELHAAMDRTVLDAYGWADIPTDSEFLLDYEIDEETWGNKKKPYRYRWPDEVRDEVLARLLELNAQRAAAEEQASPT